MSSHTGHGKHSENPAESEHLEGRGPDNMPARVLKECADQLAGVLTDIFNTWLYQAVAPSCFKTATIIPVPKTTTVSSLKDYHPVALTPIMMKSSRSW